MGPPADTPSPSRPRVLVVEDEADLADVYRHWLADGYDVTIATDGDEALDRLDERTDVVLLDRLMPGMTGDEVLTTLRERDLDCRVAMVTAVEPDVDIIPLGFDAYVVKPVSRPELLAVVERLLERSHYAAQVRRYAALAETYATLRTTKSEAELAESGDFNALTNQLTTLQAELDASIDLLADEEAFRSLLRDLA